jgi:seryl-tRNA synthetase
MGLITTFEGGEADHRQLLAASDEGRGWTSGMADSGLALCSAACHSLYPTLSGPVPRDGRRFEIEGHCFRHEPSLDPARMQCFRQHEFIYVGSADGAVAFRDEWIQRGSELLGELGLPVALVAASDPFFGRAGRFLAANQSAAQLKFELVAPIVSDTAIASANCHEDHFGVAFELMGEDSRPAHTACIGFGLERIALALIREHGMPSDWSPTFRAKLGL